MLKKTSAVFGILFALTGIVGYFPNPIVGESGLFQTDSLHNAVHLALGALLVFGSIRGNRASTNAMRTVSAVYLILALVGFMQFGGEDDTGLLLGLATANSADNWLHLALALALYLSYRIASRNGEGEEAAEEPQR